MNGLLAFFQHFDFQLALRSLITQLILEGLIITILLAVISQFLGSLIGLLLYFMRRSRFGAIRWLAEAYIWFYRGTPVYVQILFLYLALPYLSLARPLRNLDIFGHLGFSGVGTDSFIAGMVALSLNEGAYMAEIVRAGIDSIDPGQMEAAKSLGMTYARGMRRIVLPQAMRVIIPPLGNEFNNMIKTTSLASAISLNELLGIALAIGAPIFRPLELLVTAAIWYLVLTTIWGTIQAVIERRFNLANLDPASAATPPWFDRILGRGRRPVPVGVAAAPDAGPPPPIIQSGRR